MSKRLSASGRTLIMAASNAAALLGAENTEAEHFLVALFTIGPSPAASYLTGQGLTRADVEAAITDVAEVQDITFDDDDTQALAALGVDLPDLLQRLDERFGPDVAGQTPPTRRPGPRRLAARHGSSALSLIKQAMLEAILVNEAMGPEHILLALLRDPPTPCAELFQAYGLKYEDARAFMFPPPQTEAG